MQQQDPSLKDTILQTVALIPKGKVCTYGKVAEYAGARGRARYVGTVLKQLPQGSKIPWHRVINSQGKISFPQGSDQYQAQKDKLENEGISFLGGKVRLSVHLWQP